MKTICLVTAALLAALNASASIADIKELGDVSDPYMLNAMENVEEANLENAMARGRKDAERSAAHLRALIFDTMVEFSAIAGEVQGVFGDTENAPAGSLGAKAEDFAISVQVMDAKAQKFAPAARRAGIHLPNAKPEKILAARRTYRTRDRERDLRRTKFFLKNGKKRFKMKRLNLGGLRAELINIVKAFVSGGGATLRASRALQKKLRRVRKNPEAGIAARTMEPKLKQLRKNIADLELELNVLESTLKLIYLDEESFDMTK